MYPLYRPLVKSAYQKNNFLISQPKHMLFVLKTHETVLFVYLNLCLYKSNSFLALVMRKPTLNLVVCEPTRLKMPIEPLRLSRILKLLMYPVHIINLSRDV